LRACAEAPHSLHTSDRIRNASLNERDSLAVADLVTRVKKIVSDRATAKTGGRVKRSQRLV
jgi:hypothetical protein